MYISYRIVTNAHIRFFNEANVILPGISALGLASLRVIREASSSFMLITTYNENFGNDLKSITGLKFYHLNLILNDISLDKEI